MKRWCSFYCLFCFFFSSRRRHTRSLCDWSSDVCSSDLQNLTNLFQIRFGLVEQAVEADRCKMMRARSIRAKAERNVITGFTHGAVALVEVRTQGHVRSEEHTSELQSHSDLVCRLLLEKKKKKTEKSRQNIQSKKN